MFNIDSKVIAKVLAVRIKKVLPNLILPQQPAYVQHKFIGERGKLIADIKITDTYIKKDF